MTARELVQAAIQSILQERRSVFHLAASQRSKFEHWLKLELAAVLVQLSDARDVRLGAAYSAQKDRADVSLLD